MSWSDLVDENLEQQIVTWRRHFHAHPELGFEEHETTEYLARLLTEWGVEVERPTPTGLVGHIRGTKPGPVAAVRADIDALPIQEQNEFAFASQYAGRMHACGHDGHAAILLGITRALAGIRDEIPGEVRLLFQPAEERVGGGAPAFVAAGALEGVSLVLGCHLISDIPTGEVVAQAGPLMASTDEFVITVRGRGGHGAYPHQTVDALLVGAEVICALQSIVSRRVPPLSPAVLTVGTYQAGTAFNVIAGESIMTGTIRALSEEVRQLLRQEAERVAVQGAQAFGAEADFEFIAGTPVLVNEERAAKLTTEAAARVVGQQNVVSRPPTMGGEDFAFYAQRAPAGFVLVGTRNARVGSDYPHHHPHFTVDEASLAIGAKVLIEAVDQFFHHGLPLA